METTRDSLRGKQTPGKAIVNGGTVYISGASAVYTESQKMNWVEEFAMAALYAEAHNVANETKMWPKDLLERVKELEEALRPFADGYDAVKAGHTERWEEKIASDATLFGYCGFDLRIDHLRNARAILNKKP